MKTLLFKSAVIAGLFFYGVDWKFSFISVAIVTIMNILIVVTFLIALCLFYITSVKNIDLMKKFIQRVQLPNWLKHVLVWVTFGMFFKAGLSFWGVAYIITTGIYNLALKSNEEALIEMMGENSEDN